MKRRDFFQHTFDVSVGLFLLKTAGCSSRPDSPVSSDYGPQTKSGKGRIVMICQHPADPKKDLLRIFDWDSGRFSDVEIPCTDPHSISRDKTNPEQFYIYEMYGACLKVNIASGKITSSRPHSPKVLSYGHGVQNASGDSIFCTQYDRDLGQPVVAIRSAETLEQTGILPKEIGISHHLIHIPESTTVAIGNLQGNRRNSGAITFYDYVKKQVLHQADFDFPIGHVYPHSPDRFIGVTIPEYIDYVAGHNWDKYESSWEAGDKTMLSVLPKHNSPLYFYDHKNKHSELLNRHSPQQHFSYNLGITQPAGSKLLVSIHVVTGKVIVWEDLAIKKVLDVPSPYLIASSKDGSEFMVLSKSKDEVRVFSTKTLEQIDIVKSSTRVKCISSYPV